MVSYGLLYYWRDQLWTYKELGWLNSISRKCWNEYDISSAKFGLNVKRKASREQGGCTSKNI